MCKQIRDAIVTWFNITWYCIHHCGDWDRLWIRIWIRKRRPKLLVSCVRISEEVDSVITSLYANYVDNKQGTYVIILRIHLYIPTCNKWLSITIIATLPINRADSGLVTSDKETSLQSNAASHWLGANLELVAMNCGMPLCDWHPTRSNVSESRKQVSRSISQNQPNKDRNH